jgi:hypothetical protein
MAVDSPSSLGATCASKIPMVSREEEIRLGSSRSRGPAIQGRGGEPALVEGHNRFGRRPSPLTSSTRGNIGLLQAARRFDPARNVKFISYAVCGSARGSCRCSPSRAADAVALKQAGALQDPH